MQYKLEKLSSISVEILGDIPALMIREPLTKELSYIMDNAIDIGQVFFQLLESDLFGELTEKELLLRNGHKVFLRSSLDVDAHKLIQKHQGFLLIHAAKQLDTNNLGQNPTLEDIEEWTLKEEKRLGLDEYSVGGVLVVAKVVEL